MFSTYPSTVIPAFHIASFNSFISMNTCTWFTGTCGWKPSSLVLDAATKHTSDGVIGSGLADVVDFIKVRVGFSYIQRLLCADSVRPHSARPPLFALEFLAKVYDVHHII